MKKQGKQQVVTGLAFMAAAVFLAATMVSGSVGFVGAAVHEVLVGLLGGFALALPIELMAIGLVMFASRGKRGLATLALTVGDVVVVLALVVMFRAGLVGALVGDAVRDAVSTLGAVLAGSVVIATVIATGASLVVDIACKVFWKYVGNLALVWVRAYLKETLKIMRAERARKISAAAPAQGMSPQHPVKANAAVAAREATEASPAPVQLGSRERPALTAIATPARVALTVDDVLLQVVKASGQSYRLPALGAFAKHESAAAEVGDGAVQLAQVLADFGAPGKVESQVMGPTVTTFEYAPAAGTKLSKLCKLEGDLSLAMGQKVRVVPARAGRVGFEIPNAERQAVGLRELLEDEAFDACKAALPVVLGRDMTGAPVYGDLAAMPHVIVAGASGSGKSVGINVMLASLLCKKTPDEMRLLMIDPKVVELAPYNGLPHMLMPVVTDMTEAAGALAWAVSEMERRYALLAQAGCKNITSYNSKAEKADKLPYIVIVIDEFADLIMQGGKDVEAAVTRLGQKARAAGMHVILATQRPSVDVITGIIKANFSSRIAYRVAAAVDSRTILDEQGAENLLGKGDMLVKLSGEDVRRVQCPWISEEETEALVNEIKRGGRADEECTTVMSRVELEEVMA